MIPIILVLVLALLLFGAGFLVKALWWAALIVIVVWLVGFVFAGARFGSANSRRPHMTWRARSRRRSGGRRR
ncbi:MAG TPA: hydrophobic protein [Yinghuangia sp.]|nr:hydrophobic protein [Yinghuangia sp.]